MQELNYDVQTMLVLAIWAPKEHVTLYSPYQTVKGCLELCSKHINMRPSPIWNILNSPEVMISSPIRVRN